MGKPQGNSKNNCFDTKDGFCYIQRHEIKSLTAYRSRPRPSDGAFDCVSFHKPNANESPSPKGRGFVVERSHVRLSSREKEVSQKKSTFRKQSGSRRSAERSQPKVWLRLCQARGDAVRRKMARTGRLRHG